MSGDARLSTLGCPAAVAVHDDRDMPRQAIPGNRRKKPLVTTSLLNHVFEISEHWCGDRRNQKNDSFLPQAAASVNRTARSGGSTHAQARSRPPNSGPLR